MKKTFFAAKVAFLIFIFAILSGALALTVGAFSDGKLFIANFDESSSGFEVGENTVSTERAEIDSGDGELSSCLEVRSKSIPINSLRSVVKTFFECEDLSDYRKISYNMLVPKYDEDPAAVYYSRVILRSDDGRVFESIDVIEPGAWNTVVIDIGSFGGRSRISSFEAAFIVDTSMMTVVTDSFYIDDIVAFDMADAELVERFLFDSYTVDGGSASLAADKDKISVFSNSQGGVTLSAPVFMPELDYDVNCLRIKLANYTDADYFTLYYSVMDERAVSESKSVVVPIEPNSDGKFYYIPINNAGQITSISLMFGEDIGRVEIMSLGVTFTPTITAYDTHGNLSCRINDGLKSAGFSGEINRETALENQNGKIRIYKIDGEFSDISALEEMAPIIEGAMTTKFDFTWNIPSDLKLSMLEKYIAVVVAESGEYLLVSAPVCMENPEALAKNLHNFPVDAKGFYTDDLSLVTDADSGITVLEFDMLEAFLDRTDGVEYIYNGEEYYLNGEYIAEVEAATDMMAKNGTSVLIRLTNRVRSHVNLPSNVGESTAYGTDYIGAVSSYISDNFIADGRVCGVILGYGENNVSEWDNIGEMVAECAETLRKISVNLLRNNSDARVYLSVTDLFSKDILTNASELPLLEYLPALFNAASEYGKGYFGLCIESPYRVDNAKDGTYISVADNELLQSLIKNQGGLKYNPIFCDEIYKKPNKYLGMLLKNYVVGYLTAIFDDGVDGYVAVAKGRFPGLYEAVKLVDTTEAEILFKPALGMLEADSFSEVIENFDGGKLPKKLFNEGSSVYELPEKVRGQYKLYEFNSALVVSTVAPTYYDLKCGLAADAEKNTVLSVAVNGEADAAPSVFGVCAAFKYTENLEFMSWIGVDLKIDGTVINNDKKIPIKLVLTSAGERFESGAEVSRGEWTKVYFNVDSFKSARDTKELKLLVNCEEFEVLELRVKDIVGLSEEYNNESLESVVLEERLKKRNPDGANDYGPYMWLGGGLLIAVATGAAVAMLSRKKRVEK